jgi:hypothetical protein
MPNAAAISGYARRYSLASRISNVVNRATHFFNPRKMPNGKRAGRFAHRQASH